MERHGRRALFASAIVWIALTVAAAPASASIIHFEFLSGSLRGDLAIVESPFVGWEFDPAHSGHYYTTATLTFGPIDQPPTVSIPSQDIDILVYQDLDACCQRFYGKTDELHMVSTGPYASYEFWFSQLFNGPGTGFLKSTSLSDPPPVFFPYICPSNTVPCRDGPAYPLLIWRFDEPSFHTITDLVATTTVPEPGVIALMGTAAVTAIFRTCRTRHRPRR